MREVLGDGCNVVALPFGQKAPKFQPLWKDETDRITGNQQSTQLCANSLAALDLASPRCFQTRFRHHLTDQRQCRQLGDE